MLSLGKAFTENSPNNTERWLSRPQADLSPGGKASDGDRQWCYLVISSAGLSSPLLERRVSGIQNKEVRKGVTEKVTSGQRPKSDEALVLWLSEGRKGGYVERNESAMAGAMMMPKEQQGCQRG